MSEEENYTIPIKYILDMLEDLNNRRDKEPVIGYWSKKAMLEKIIKTSGFNYKKYKEENK